jgi:ankyrin repeat protein
MAGQVDVVKLLIGNGANPNDNDRDGLTPLHHAAYEGHLGVVTTLIHSGASPGRLDREGQTALHMAASGGHCDVVDFLLHEDWKPEPPGYAGVPTPATPLMTAVVRGRADVVRLVLALAPRFSRSDIQSLLELTASPDSDVHRVLSEYQSTRLDTASITVCDLCAVRLSDGGHTTELSVVKDALSEGRFQPTQAIVPRLYAVVPAPGPPRLIPYLPWELLYLHVLTDHTRWILCGGCFRRVEPIPEGPTIETKGT